MAIYIIMYWTIPCFAYDICSMVGVCAPPWLPGGEEADIYAMLAHSVGIICWHIMLALYAESSSQCVGTNSVLALIGFQEVRRLTYTVT